MRINRGTKFEQLGAIGMQRHCPQSKGRRGQIEPQKNARVGHRHHSPIEVTGVMAWNEPLQASTLSTFARYWKPKRTRRSGERLCSYCPRSKQNWLRLLRNPRTKSTFGHSYLAPPFPFNPEQLANKGCATRALIRPHPERVRARLALPRSQPHIFFSIHATTRSHALR